MNFSLSMISTQIPGNASTGSLCDFTESQAADVLESIIMQVQNRHVG